MQLGDRFKNLFRKRAEKEKAIYKKNTEYVNWLYIIVKEGMVRDIEKVEKMSIWKVCEILDYLALENDKQNEFLEKQKIKHKR